MEIKFLPSNTFELDVASLTNITSQFSLDPTSRTVFLEQRLPELYNKLWNSVQVLKQNVTLMLENALPNYEKEQKMTQTFGAPLIDLNSLKGIIKQEYPKFIKETRHLIRYANQLKSVVEQFGQMHPDLMSQAIPAIRTLVQELSTQNSKLIKNSILVLKHPTEVIKKQNQFDSDLELLIDVPGFAPDVRLRIISAADANGLRAGTIKCSQIQSAAGTLNNDAKFVNTNGSLLSDFVKPQLKEITSRTQPSGGKKAAVTEQKYFVLYEIQLNRAQKEKLGYPEETIWALSLPVVLIVHANQLSDAYATIVWDRLFGEKLEADWGQFAWLLNASFKHIAGASRRPLSDKDIIYFRQKLEVEPQGKITFKRFAKDKIGSQDDMKFSFWTWFEAIAQLIKAKLLPYWEKGYIMGFLSKEEVSEEIRKRSNQAVFLLRFSDSKLGTVSVSTFRHNEDGLLEHAPFLLPPSQLDLANSLVHLLKDFDEIKKIWYICDKEYILTEKGIVFADPDLNVKTNSVVPEEQPAGYHKLKTVIKGDSKSDTEDAEHVVVRKRSTSFSTCSSMAGMRQSPNQVPSRTYSGSPPDFFSTSSTGEFSFFPTNHHFSATATPTETAGSYAMGECNSMNIDGTWTSPTMSGHGGEFGEFFPGMQAPAEIHISNQWAPSPHVQNMQHFNQPENYYDENLQATLAAAMGSSAMDH